MVIPQPQMEQYLPAQFYKMREDVAEPNYSFLCGNPHPAAIEIIKELLEIDPEAAYDPETINWENISLNPFARELITQYPDFIEWYYACANPAAIHELTKHIRKHTTLKNRLNWFQLSYNTSPEAIKMLEDTPSRVCGYAIAQNPAAVSIIKKFYVKIGANSQDIFPVKIRFEYLAGNPHPEIIQYVKEEMAAFLETADEEDMAAFWESLSNNPSEEAARILEKNIDKIVWYSFSKNPSPTAMRIISANLDKVFWANLAANPSPRAVEIVRDKLRGGGGTDVFHFGEFVIRDDIQVIRNNLYRNPAIFTYDYEKMRSARSALHEDLIAWYWHPSRISAFLDAGGDIENLE